MTSEAGAARRTPAVDPVLWDAVHDLERPDLDDVAGARRLMGSDGLPVASSEQRFGGTVRVHDTVAAGSRGPVRLRVHRPATGEPTSVVLLLHGGAFVGGDALTEHARSLRYVAETGCAVVSPEYGLAPELPYPAALDDCASALAWAAEELGTDVPVVVGGVSAGAALAAGLGLRVRDLGGPVIAALLLLFPVLDDRLATTSMRRYTDTPVWDAGNSALMWRDYLGGGPADAYAAPARAGSLDGLPPTYLAIAEVDPLRDEALDFARRLLDDEVTVDVRLWASTVHVFDQLVPDAPVSERSIADQVAFLRRIAGHQH